MTRARQPHIDLSDDDAAVLRKANFNHQSVLNWRKKIHAPSRICLSRINAALGRDVRQPAPVAAPPPAPTEPVVSSRVAPHPHIEVNPCIDDAVCLAVRTAAMRPVANTLLDQRWEIPCVSCKEGIRRARVEAAKKTAHIGALVCSCGEEKSRDARTCHACASDRRKSYRAQPLRGMKGETV